MHVILPSAGKGTRLGLPYPKEIHRVVEGASLIDFSLSHILGENLVKRISLTISPEKQAVVDYVRSKTSEIEVCTSLFDERYTEWPGSILSAQEHFMDRNIALLPDSSITPRPNTPLMHSFSSSFENGYDIVFAYLPVDNNQNISALGALKIAENGRDVVDFCDKPSEQSSAKYNAFWTAFGFTAEASNSLLELMMRSVAREPVDILSLGFNIGAFPVDGYIDLGTWANMRRFQAGGNR
tara:strand:- start:4676 stop:5392 length:717 start_codon:yes stop_codon:yes gene_type:complete